MHLLKTIRLYGKVLRFVIWLVEAIYEIIVTNNLDIVYKESKNKTKSFFYFSWSFTLFGLGVFEEV